MATEQQTAATKADLDASFNDMKGYVDTAVDTLTTEMDRQFKQERQHMDRRFDEILQAIKEHQHV
jgi:hypothetical protein